MSKKQVERMGLHVETEAPYDVDYSTGEILTKFPDKGFSNNPAKTVWKPDMTNISPELRKMFRERQQPDDVETTSETLEESVSHRIGKSKDIYIEKL